MKVSIIDRQEVGCVDCRSLGKIVRRVMRYVKPEPPAAAWDMVSVILTDDILIRRINLEFLNHDRTTDVVSFTYPALPGQNSGVTGEIFVNVQQALRLGPRYGGASRELALYAAHGCDHLSGANDATQTERRRMRDRECRWLRSSEIQCLLRRLVLAASSSRPA